MKKDIILENALRNFTSVEDFIRFLEQNGSPPYDIDSDPKGLVRWYYASRDYVTQVKFATEVNGIDDFTNFVDKLIDYFEVFIQENGGWKLLYSDDGLPRSEEICQLAFLGIVKHICFANDIDVTRETNIGRGPVDFKFSRGFRLRALIEMKLARNSKFWNGLAKQLPKYLKAEGVNIGRFLVIAFESDEAAKVADVQKKAIELSKSVPYELRSKVVLVEYKPLSASKL